jgi:hypothetical protein
LKNEKISKKLMLEKEEKGFNAMECCLVDETIGEKYFASYLDTH